MSHCASLRHKFAAAEIGAPSDARDTRSSPLIFSHGCFGGPSRRPRPFEDLHGALSRPAHPPHLGQRNPECLLCVPLCFELGYDLLELFASHLCSFRFNGSKLYYNEIVSSIKMACFFRRGLPAMRT